jgi:hypothetical protein
MPSRSSRDESFPDCRAGPRGLHALVCKSGHPHDRSGGRASSGGRLSPAAARDARVRLRTGRAASPAFGHVKRGSGLPSPVAGRSLGHPCPPLARRRLRSAILAALVVVRRLPGRGQPRPGPPRIPLEGGCPQPPRVTLAFAFAPAVLLRPPSATLCGCSAAWTGSATVSTAPRPAAGGRCSHGRAARRRGSSRTPPRSPSRRSGFP